jgi:hypothetical protein
MEVSSGDFCECVTIALGLFLQEVSIIDYTLFEAVSQRSDKKGIIPVVVKGSMNRRRVIRGIH